MGGRIGTRVGGRVECSRGGEAVLKGIAGGGIALSGGDGVNGPFGGMGVCCAGSAGGRDGSEIEMGMEFDGKLNATCSGGGLGVCANGGVESGCCCCVGMPIVLIVVLLVSGIRLGREGGDSPRLLISLFALDSDNDNGIAGMRRWVGSLEVDGGEI